MIVCLHCNRNDNIKNHRENAKKHQQKHADVIQSKSLERFAPALVGDTVMVPVPDVDRGHCDFRNIKAVVVECHPNALYRLGTKLGLLKQAYSRNQFTPVKEKFLDISNVSFKSG